MPSTVIPARSDFNLKVLLSQHLKLFCETDIPSTATQADLASGTATATTTELSADNIELASIQTTDIGSDAQLATENYGTTRIYYPQQPDRDFSFMIHCSHDAMESLITRGTFVGDPLVLPTYKWRIQYTAPEGDVNTAEFDGILFRYNFSKIATPNAPVTGNCTIRIVSDITNAYP